MRLLGIDTGGTFTDFIYVDGDEATVEKRPSTPHDPSEVIREAVAKWIGDDLRIGHGSTVATNTLLERRGAKTALVATRGFGDVVEIGRQDRPRIYALDWRPPPPLVPRELRFEVNERTGPGGEVLEPLDELAVEELRETLREEGVESVAVCFLFSPENRRHERRAVELLSRLAIPVIASSEIHPELREYERFSTTTISAYVSPVMDRYLAHLARDVAPARFLVMESGGGVQPWEHLHGQAVRTILSGPAGGVVATEAFARARGGSGAAEGVVAFDMGGTSTDVCLIRDRIPYTREFRIDGLPAAVPVVDVVTVGAGGGSEGWVDAGGALRAGPRSAGAVPGPVCYGRGNDVPTVTDAHCFIGHLPRDTRLGGTMPLQPDGIERSLRRLGDPLGLSPLAVARGIIQVIEAEMERALRRITQERGVDPRGLTLVSFGGAGGLHAVSLARGLGIPRVWIPPDPGIFSATGMILAPEVETGTRTVMATLDGALLRRLDTELKGWEDTSRRRLLALGVGDARAHAARELSMRYVGQSHELDILWHGSDPRTDFHAAYRQRYGYAEEDRHVEVTAVRSRLGVSTVRVLPRPKPDGGVGDPTARAARVFLDGFQPVPVPRHRRHVLKTGEVVRGPAIIEEISSTLWLPPASALTVAVDGGLEVEPSVG